MNKAEEKLLKLCANLVSEAGKLYGTKKTENLNPCGVTIFVFSENKNAVICSGKIKPFEILKFLIANCEGVMFERVPSTPPPFGLKSQRIN